MSGDEEEKVETRGQMTQRHKREAMMLKKQTQKMGKKRKAEAKKLEQELAARHEEEIRRHEEREKAGAGEEEAQDPGAGAAAASTTTAASTSGEAAAEKKGPTRAQKRREAKAAKEAEREARIALEKASMGETPEQQEFDKIEEILLSRNFVLRDIPPDGNCMFRALEDQLTFQSTEALGFAHTPVHHASLRKMAVGHILSNRETFEAFLEEPLESYCERMGREAEWGGHCELQAISTALGVPIEVYSADSGGRGPLRIGEESLEGAPLRVSYHLHAYGLGEHYNSVRPIVLENNTGAVSLDDVLSDKVAETESEGVEE